jgi:hypothetical protein
MLKILNRLHKSVKYFFKIYCYCQKKSFNTFKQVNYPKVVKLISICLKISCFFFRLSCFGRFLKLWSIKKAFKKRFGAQVEEWFLQRLSTNTRTSVCSSICWWNRSGLRTSCCCCISARLWCWQS